MSKIYTLFFLAILITPFTAAAQYYVKDETGLYMLDSLGQKIPVSSLQKNKEKYSLRAIGYEVSFSDKDRNVFSSHEEKADNGWKYTGYSGHWAMFELGFNNFTPANYIKYSDGEKGFLDLNLGKSIYISWNLLNFSYSLNKSETIGMTTGLGLVWRNYVFSHNVTVEEIDGMLRPVWPEDNLKKSKINTFSLFVPVVLEFGQYNGWFFSAGVYADLIISSQTKTKLPQKKHRGNFFLNNLQAGVTARLGYNRIYVFGNFALVNMFNVRKAPQTQAYTFGLGFGF